MTTNTVRHLCTLEQWDFNYFDLAHHIKSWSKDPKKKVGAVLVGGDDKRRVSLGVNGLPPGFDDRAWMDREDKNKFIMHAERNALDNANFSTVGGTLYSTRFPCPGCAGSVLSMGVTRVVVPPIESVSSWSEEQEAALELLNGAVDLVFVRDGLLDEPTQQRFRKAQVDVQWRGAEANTDVVYRCLGCYQDFDRLQIFDGRGFCPKCSEMVTPGGRHD